MAHKGERGAGCITKIKFTDKNGQRKESRFWYILYYQDGRQIRESSGSEVKQRAKELLRQRLGERALGFQPHQDLKKIRYEDIRQSLLDDYAANRLHSLQTLADGKEEKGRYATCPTFRC